MELFLLEDLDIKLVWLDLPYFIDKLIVNLLLMLKLVLNIIWNFKAI